MRKEEEQRKEAEKLKYEKEELEKKAAKLAAPSEVETPMNTTNKKKMLGDDAMAGMLLTAPETSTKSKSDTKGKKASG